MFTKDVPSDEYPCYSPPMENKISVSKFLKEKLEKKQLQNKSYSLRAFALKMGISPGGLAQILSGKKKLSFERAHEIATALKLTKDEKKLFLLAAEFEQSKRPERKAEVYEQIKKLNTKGATAFFDLSVDQFNLISEWYGLAILECASSYGKNFDVKDFANHFGISNNNVSLTLERLIRLELIEVQKDGSWARIKDRVLITSLVPNEAIRSYYHSVAQRSLISYQTQTPQQKISAAETFTFDPDQLEEVRLLTDEYLDKIVELSRQSKNKSTTYQALINVFRLNETQKENV